MASFDCLGCHQLHLNPKRGIPNESAEGWKDTIFTIYTKNALFRSYGAFAYARCAEGLHFSAFHLTVQ